MGSPREGLLGKLLCLSEPQVPHPVMEMTKSTLHGQVYSRYLISKGTALLISHLKWVEIKCLLSLGLALAVLEASAHRIG